MLVGIHLDVWDELVIATKVTRCPVLKAGVW